MASQAQLDRIIGKALHDTAFRRLLFDDPAAAARSLRLKLDEDQLARIRKLDPAALEQVARSFLSATGARADSLIPGIW
jgi:hypothetical protein